MPTDYLWTVEGILAQHAEGFHQRVWDYRNEFGSGIDDVFTKRYRRDIGFEGAWPENREYSEFKYLERFLEALIRSELVNPALKDLFELYGIESEWPDDDSESTRNSSPRDYRTNLGYERANGFEFITKWRGKKTAFIYCDDISIENRLTAEMKKRKVEDVFLVDWTRLDRVYPSIRLKDYYSISSMHIGYVAIRQLIEAIFSAEVWQAFFECITTSVADANDILGFHTIPSLSMQHIDSFKAKVIANINSERDDLTSGEISIAGNRLADALNDDDLKKLKKAFFDDGLIDKLIGGEGFAKCFITSEYLCEVFKNGGKFDYTAVATGYLKAVEQLEYALMKLTLNTNDQETRRLKIKRLTWKDAPDDHAFTMLNKTPCVYFRTEYEEYFDTTLKSLVYLLNGYTKAWVSKEIRLFAKKAVVAFADKDRNPYFHKSNMDDLAMIKEIRKEALSIVYLLLSGYTLADGLSD